MAIAFGGSNARLSLNGAGPFTSPSLSVIGSDVYGIACFWATASVSSVTWNGVTMTLIKSFATVPQNGSATAYVYGLAGVTTGSVEITLGASNTGDCYYAFYTGVVGGLDTATPVTATNASTTDLSITLTTDIDNSWMIVFGMARDVPGTGISAGTNATGRVSGTNDGNIFDSNGPVHPAGSLTMHTTQASASAMSSIAFALAASLPTTANGDFLSFM